jgi:multicomponent Na+:H+ antiporter subunit B
MTRRARIAVFASSALVLASLLGWGFSGLPRFGEFGGDYGEILNHVAVGERHATNVVAAVVFDYRGIDTMGEEFILFTSVMAVALLLREARDRDEERPFDRIDSESLRLVGLGAVGAVVVLGLSIVAHGYITPGGGFQGGVVCAAALVLLYAAGSYRTYRSASPFALLEAAEGVGAGGYALVGVATLATGSAFLADVLPLGRTGSLASTGTIAVLNGLAGLEVAAALALLFHELVEELMDPTSPGGGAS